MRCLPDDFAAIVRYRATLPYANSRMGCGLQDGNSYTLDSVHDGKRFFISASNPVYCRDAGSKAMSALIQALQHLRSSSSSAK